MKKTIRTIIGALLMAFDLVIAVLSMWLFPQPFDLGGFLFSFLPPMLIGLSFVSIGWGVITGMTWRDALDFIFMAWR